MNVLNNAECRRCLGGVTLHEPAASELVLTPGLCVGLSMEARSTVSRRGAPMVLLVLSPFGDILEPSSNRRFQRLLMRPYHTLPTPDDTSLQKINFWEPALMGRMLPTASPSPCFIVYVPSLIVVRLRLG